jgi:hypothetical protein
MGGHLSEKQIMPLFFCAKNTQIILKLTKFGSKSFRIKGKTHNKQKDFTHIEIS